MLATFVSALLAGFAIGIGGSVYLPLMGEHRIAGALLFSVGLFTVILFRLHLYTGKICYVLQTGGKPLSRIGNMSLILLGNAVGAAACGLLLSGKLSGVAAPLVAAKLEVPLLRVFCLAAFCGVLIYIAVEGYRRAPAGGVQAVIVLLGVAVFILAGFEHSVADIFYVAAARAASWEAVLFLAVVVAGNTVGGIAFASLHALYDRLTAKAA